MQYIGDGKGKPTGIFAATGGAENGATTTGAAITFDDVIELFYSLKSPYRKKAVWILYEQTVKALRKIKDNTGNFIWQPSVSAGLPDTILNRPYVTSVYAPTIAAGAKAIAFGDYIRVQTLTDPAFRKHLPLFSTDVLGDLL